MLLFLYEEKIPMDLAFLLIIVKLVLVHSTLLYCATA